MQGSGSSAAKASPATDAEPGSCVKTAAVNPVICARNVSQAGKIRNRLIQLPLYLELSTIISLLKQELDSECIKRAIL